MQSKREAAKNDLPTNVNEKTEKELVAVHGHFPPSGLREPRIIPFDGIFSVESSILGQILIFRRFFRPKSLIFTPPNAPNSDIGAHPSPHFAIFGRFKLTKRPKL